MSQDSFFDFMMSEKKGMKMPRGDKNTIPDYKISLPPLTEQKRIVGLVTAEEQKIAAAKQIMAECPERKRAVLQKWL